MACLPRMALVVFAIFSALLMLGCVSTQPQQEYQAPVQQPSPSVQQNTTTVQPAAAAPCANSSSPSDRDSCFLSLAESTGNQTFCQDIYSVGTMDSCYAQFSSEGIGICQDIVLPGDKDACVLLNAKRDKSQSECGQISNASVQQACLDAVLPPCLLLNGTDAQDLCLAIQNKNYTICNSDSCLMSYAINQSDPSACAIISTQADALACKAIVQNDIDICSGASSNSTKDSCVQIAAEAANSLFDCSYADEQSMYRNNCYTDFAINQTNDTICALCDPESAQDTCYAAYAIAVGDASACAKIFDNVNKIGCYFHSAATDRMPSLCNGLSNPNNRNACYSGAILEPAAGPVASDCADVNDSIWQGKCYYMAAQMTANSSLCALITNDPSDFASCQQLFT